MGFRRSQKCYVTEIIILINLIYLLFVVEYFKHTKKFFHEFHEFTTHNKEYQVRPSATMLKLVSEVPQS